MADPRLAYMATRPQFAQLVGLLPVRLANNHRAESSPEQKPVLRPHTNTTR